MGGSNNSLMNIGLWSKEVINFKKENYIEGNFLICKTHSLENSDSFYGWDYTLHNQMPYFWKSERMLFVIP